MNPSSAALPEAQDGALSAAPDARVVGRAGDSSAGPLLMVVGGIHGNEPAGVGAMERVFERLAVLEKKGVALRGRFVGVRGNRRALEVDQRCIEEDLNRRWTREQVARFFGPHVPFDAPEDLEQKEMLETLESEADRAAGQMYFLDFHTSSAPGVPFACIGDTLRNRRFARSFPVPVILGLEEQVEGALLEFLNNCGAVTMGVEGGQHRSPEAVDRLEAVLWIALVSAGILRSEEVPGFREAVERLAVSTAGIPRLLEVRHRHGIPEGAGFVMEPGFRNFQEVHSGELLARQDGRPLHAFYDSLILLPLYQEQGDDGFFLAREVRPFWLRISAVLRYLRLGAIAHWLPGVSRDPEHDGRLRVNPSVARWYVFELFHLLGYRKRRPEDHHLVVSRRRFDLRPPRRVRIR